VRARSWALALLGRLGGVLFVVWGAATAGFVALKLIPGDPVDVMLGVQARVSEQVKDQIRQDWGLGDPPAVQYLLYLRRLVTGDLGQSYQLRQPVAEVIGAQLPSTVALAALAIGMALAIALATALFARGGAARLLSLVELVLVSSPTFWIGLVLISVFAFGLRWFPLAAGEGLPALILPALTLALPISGIISQVLRQSLESSALQPFALSARARGVGPVRLVTHHGLRHAAADGVTLTGYILGSLLGGAVLVETVFGRPGIGRVALRAIIDRDLPVVLGIIVLAAALFAVINVVVDLSYSLIDPRLRVAR
jgi:peptide/nickel transport system permease protein